MLSNLQRECNNRVLPKIWSRGRITLSRRRTMTTKRRAVVLSGPCEGGGPPFTGGPGASPRKFWNWGSKKMHFGVIKLSNNGFKFFFKEKEFHWAKKYVCLSSITSLIVVIHIKLRLWICIRHHTSVIIILYVRVIYFE